MADALAHEHDWTAVTIPAGSFDLVAYLPESPRPTSKLTIYLEGDGLAWITGTQASSNPTPRDPIALRLALAQRDGAVAYLGRPCQLVDAEARHCASRYWMDHRFAPEVIESTSRAIDSLKQRFAAQQLTLVGYSGGGAVAALVAASRPDVERLVTVAGNLDHKAWTSYQRIRPLEGSLNPVDWVTALTKIPQWHFVGKNDANITPALVQGFARLFPPNQRPVVRIEQEFDHLCCWAEQWPSLWEAFQPKQ